MQNASILLKDREWIRDFHLELIKNGKQEITLALSFPIDELFIFNDGKSNQVINVSLPGVQYYNYELYAISYTLKLKKRSSHPCE